MNLSFNYQLCNPRHITTGSLFLHLKNMNHGPRVTGRTLVKTTMIICTLMSALPTPRNMLFILLTAVLLAPTGSGHRRCSINAYSDLSRRYRHRSRGFKGILGDTTMRNKRLGEPEGGGCLPGGESLGSCSKR